MTDTRRLLAAALAGSLVTLGVAVAAAQGSQSAAPATPAAPASASTGPSGPAVAPAALSSTVSACHTDAVAANRYAIFASQMLSASVPGTLTMSVNFQLQERAGAGAGFATVDAPGFGSWVTSQRGVGIFTYSHEVTALPAPAAFRVLVRARWLGRHRRVVHRSEILSPVCVEPLLAPDLTIGAIGHSRGSTPATTVYDVQVRNTGTLAAGPFEVALTVAGTALAPFTLPSLAAGTAQVVQFTGPRCGAGDTLTAVADPTAAVSEPADPKRTKSIACPLP